MRGVLLGLILSVVPLTALAQPAPAPNPAPSPVPAPEAAPPEAEPVPDAGAPAALPDPAPLPEPEKTPVTPQPPPELEDKPVSPADGPLPGGWRLMLSDLTVFRWNPLGLETRGRLGLQKQLYASEKAISRTNFMFLGAYPKLNPASAQLGIGGEIQPLSIFNLRALAEVQQFFGTFGFLQSFPTPVANYSDQTLKDLRDSSTLSPQATHMLHLSIQPMLQLKVGPIAVRSLLQLDYWDFNGRAGDTVAYEPTMDTLLPDQGWTLATDTDVLYVGRPGLALGLRHTYVRPFYRRGHFASAAGDNGTAFDAYDGENSHHRLGVFGAYTLRDEGPSTFNKPTIVLILSWYLSHRYRTGQPDNPLPTDTRADDFTSRAVPYLILGFAFESDFLAVH